MEGRNLAGAGGGNLIMIQWPLCENEAMFPVWVRLAPIFEPLDPSREPVRCGCRSKRKKERYGRQRVIRDLSAFNGRLVTQVDGS